MIVGEVKDIVKYRFLIKTFVTDIKGFGPREWAREVKISKKLFKTYPEFDFWKSFKLGFELDSLCYFLGEKGSAQVKLIYLNFNYRVPEKNKPAILAEKIGEDFPLPIKDKKFFDFKAYR